MSAVFEGVKVADFSWVAVGPFTSRYFAAFGATVVRIESMLRPDPWRTAAPFKDHKVGIDRSAYYGYHNANKYSIAIDLNHLKGREVAKKLAVWADIVIENFRPGMMERWGLAYEDLIRINPDLIMLSTSNQGATGPLAKQPGYGFHLAALSGFSYYSGWPDRDPIGLSTAYTDCITPHFAAAALTSALIYRRKTGKGQLIDMSQLETSVHFLAPLILGYTANGQVGDRNGNYCSNSVPHGVYRCKGDDRWCAIAVSRDEEWEVFCNVIGDPTWTKDSKFRTFPDRKHNENELDSLVEQWTINFTPEEVMEQMQNAGIAAGVVKNGKDIYEDPQLKERGAFWRMDHNEIGPLTHLGEPFKLSKTAAEPRMPAPCLGEHTEHVCKQFLKMSDEEFDRLLVEGVFQ